MNCTAEIIDRELESTGYIFRSPKDSLSEDALISFDFAGVASKLQDATGAQRLLQPPHCRQFFSENP